MSDGGYGGRGAGGGFAGDEGDIWQQANQMWPSLGGRASGRWLNRLINEWQVRAAGKGVATMSDAMFQYILGLVNNGANDDQLDQAYQQALAQSPLAPKPPTGGGGGGGSTAQPTEFQTIWSNMSLEDRQRYIQLQTGGMTGYQSAQSQAAIDAANRAYDLQNRQFAWQQQEAARAREEARLQRATEQGSRPRDWATLWQMYGGEKGLPQGYTPPALEPEVQIPSWTAALQAAPQVQAPAGGYAVPTTTPLPSILRGAIEGRAAPTGGMFRMPEGAGVLPSAQYLGELPGTALEGLAGVYGKEFGLSWDDIVQAVQRSLPRKSATASTSLMALGR